MYKIWKLPSFLCHFSFMAKFLLFSAVLTLGLILTCEATIFIVGDSSGWDVSADLQLWAANKVFNVGDVLWFQYTRYHNVSEVNSAGYNSCNTTNAILTGTGGNTTVTLTSPGEKYYFVSGVPLYCFGGMRLQVDVQGGNATAPAASTGSPGVLPASPPSTTSRPSTRTSNLSPPDESGALHGKKVSSFETGVWTFGVLLWIVVTWI